MLEMTPQERMALIVLAVLLVAGAIGRHSVYRSDLKDRVQYSSEGADTLNPGSDSPLRRRVEQEVAREQVRRTPLEAGERIDPNRATADELARLPRIGPALAERIVAHRRTAGPFRGPADLRAVQGIGPALLEGITPHLDFSRAPPPVGTRNSLSGNQIDLNRASAAELQTLSGIGPAIAERIVAYRREHGRFRRFEDLENVSGIGPRLRQRLQREARLGT